MDAPTMESSVDGMETVGDRPSGRVDIQIVSDITCPWCWLSKRRLDEAMASLPRNVEFELEWSPFLLDPSIPGEGIPNGNYQDPNDVRVQSLRELGEELGIEFKFSCPISPNTLPCHVLLDFIKETYGGFAQGQVIEELFKAYFTDGLPLDRKCLMAIARIFDVNVSDLTTALDDPERIEKVRKLAETWRQKGIKAVPFFIMNGHSACSGAQSIQDFAATILKVVDKFPADKVKNEEDASCVSAGDNI